LNGSKFENITQISRLCCAFYFLTLPVMTPTFISLIHPSNTAVKAVSRNMNIAFICVIESLATAADLKLLHRITYSKENSDNVRWHIIKDMWIFYACIWLSICADIACKVYRDETNALIADLPITNLTLTLRCVAALVYGTTIRNDRELFSMQSLPWVNCPANGNRYLPSQSVLEHSSPGQHTFGKATVTIATEFHDTQDAEVDYYPGSKGREG